MRPALLQSWALASPLAALALLAAAAALPRRPARWLAATLWPAAAATSLTLVAAAALQPRGAVEVLPVPLPSWGATAGSQAPTMLMWDGPSAAGLLLACGVCLLSAALSWRVGRQEPGAHRRAAIGLLGLAGAQLLFGAATLEVLAAGWELLGLAALLLAGLPWWRPEAVARATSAFASLRLGGVVLATAAMMATLPSPSGGLGVGLAAPEDLALAVAGLEPVRRWLLAGPLLLAAIGASAQLPAMAWLPRVLTAPAHAGGLLCGAITVHAGVFLLARTAPIWRATPGFAVLLGAVGAATAAAATAVGRTQATCTAQIGYRAIAQVGLMLGELALGLDALVLPHLVGHALLRCGQLLLAPAVAVAAMRALPVPHLPAAEAAAAVASRRPLAARLRAALYVLASTEFSSVPASARTRRRRAVVLGLLALALALLAPTATDIWTPSAPAAGWLAIAVLLALTAHGERRRPGVLLAALALSQAALAAAAATGGGEAASLARLAAACWAPSLALSAGLLAWLGRRLGPLRLSPFAGLQGCAPAACGCLLAALSTLGGTPLAATFLGERLLLGSLAASAGSAAPVVAAGVLAANGAGAGRLFAALAWGRRPAAAPGVRFDLRPAPAAGLAVALLALQVVALWCAGRPA